MDTWVVITPGRRDEAVPDLLNEGEEVQTCIA